MDYYYLPVNEISQKIDNSLFAPVRDLVNDMKEDLIIANNKTIGKDAKGFRHLSQFFTIEDIGSDVYKLPFLDTSLFSKFADYLSFTKEWERKELYVSQFIRKVLLKAIEPKFIDTEDTSYFTDLGNVLPAYLLQLTNLHYSSTNYIEDPNLHNDWVKITPIINEMQAMKMVTNK